jgi:hypothetical protein
VIHGEDVSGPVSESPWSLLCPVHSNIPAEDVPNDATSVEALIQVAKEFPPEPIIPPSPIPPKPFNTATGSERDLLLMNRAYENELLVELTTKKIFGMRCEVCDQEVETRRRAKCVLCSVVFCEDCKLDCEDVEGSFKCEACCYNAAKEKCKESGPAPQCIACNMKGGLLRKGEARPVYKKRYWKAHKKAFESTLFSQQLWVHSVCAL